MIIVALFTAKANGLDFAQRISPCEQVLATRKRFTLKVCADANGQHRNGKCVDDLAEPIHLSFAEKLGFINKYAVDGFFSRSLRDQF